MEPHKYERQKRYYERRKQARKAPGDAIAPVRPFFEFFEGHSDRSEFTLPLELANIIPPAFEDDAPATFPDGVIGLDLPAKNNSLERAELTIASLLDAASGLAAIVNEFKSDEIASRLAEIEAAEAPDPGEIDRLHKMRDRLAKPTRWTLPQWKAGA